MTTFPRGRKAFPRVLHNSSRTVALCLGFMSIAGCMWYPRSMDTKIAKLQLEVADERSKLQVSAAPYYLMPGEAFAIAVSADPLRVLIEQYDRPNQIATLVYQSPSAITFLSDSGVCWFLGVPYDVHFMAAALTRIDIDMTFRLWNPTWNQDGFRFTAYFVGGTSLIGAVFLKPCGYDPSAVAIPPGVYPLPLPPVATAVADIQPADNGDLQVYATVLDPVTVSVFDNAGLTIPALVPVSKIDNPIKAVVPIKFLKDKPPLCFRLRFVTDNVINKTIGPRASGSVSISKIPPDGTGLNCPTS
jgi:hypothetical protein